jgi:hypothetical protein
VNQDNLVSLTTFKRLSQNGRSPIKSIDNIQYSRMFLKLVDDVDEDKLSNLKLKLRMLNLGININDVEDRLRVISIAQNVMFFFLVFSTFVAMFMCFFSLSASMFSNIQEVSNFHKCFSNQKKLEYSGLLEQGNGLYKGYLFMNHSY